MSHLLGSHGGSKFSYLNIRKSGITSWPDGVSQNFVAASLSSASWNRFAATMNSLKAFSLHSNIAISWPLSKNLVRSYVNWALSVKKLRPESVKVYISDLKLAHKLRDKQIEFDNDFFINSMLKGAKNISLYTKISRSQKFVMTFPLIILLGHEIASSNWDPASKLVFWSACCTAFFGSFRLCEILPKSEKNEPETLTWDRVRFTQKNSIVSKHQVPQNHPQSSGRFCGHIRNKKLQHVPFFSIEKFGKIRSSRSFSKPSCVSLQKRQKLDNKHFYQNHGVTVRKTYWLTSSKLLRPLIQSRHSVSTGTLSKFGFRQRHHGLGQVVQ